MMDRLTSLDRLYLRFDEFADGTRLGGGAWEAHAAVVDRLADNRRIAEERGWTSCAMERTGQNGRPRMWGVPPGERLRHAVPDWPAAPAATPPVPDGSPVRAD